ncbi:MAG: arsenic resistance protein [Candidatus Limnocylindrales bacterium]
MKRLQEHLSRWIVGYVAAAMLLGLLIGYPTEAIAKARTGLLDALATVLVFAVVYPMMINLRLGAVATAARHWRILALALGYSFLWAPSIGYVLSRLFLHDSDLAIGFLLVMVVPCSSMSVGYTGLAKGNVELATLVVGTSFLAAMVAAPAWMALFAGRYQVPLPIDEMLATVAEVLLAPMILGTLTRTALERWLGPTGYQRLQPLFPAASLLAMFSLIGVLFFAKAGLILDRWSTVVLLVVPGTLYISLSLALETWIDRRLGLSYRDHMAVVFAASSSNNATAIAVATLAFSPLVAVPAATAPIAQQFLLAAYVRLAPWVRAYFGEGAALPDPARTNCAPR